MGDLSVTNLYRKVVSPSVKVKTEELKKETHTRHVQYRGRSPVSPRRLAPSPSRSTYSAPGRVESQTIPFQTSITYGCHDNNKAEQDGHYYFHPTTHFKTTSLPAMPLTKKYIHSAPGTSRIVPLSVTRHSVLCLPEKWPSDKPLFTTQRQRKTAEERAKSESRKLKRKSEIISHRIDKQYYMCGTQIPVKNRWNVDTNDLLRLKLLAHQKQLANYKNVKSLQDELKDARESPGGQMSTPTPHSEKENGYDEPRGLSPERETEGKWAEDSKSETSSMDEFDSISLRGRRIKLPSSSQQNDINSDNIEVGKSEAELGEDVPGKTDENDNKESEKLNENLDESPLDINKAKNDSECVNKVDKVDSSVMDEEKVTSARENKLQNADNVAKEQIEKPLEGKARKKIKTIRFKDEINVKNSIKGNKTKDKHSKSSETKQGDEKSEHVNPYLDEWLGIKKKELVDGRYKPGKPPPNRIFISTAIPKSKKAEIAKFSEMFLTETIALQENVSNVDNDVSPESKFGIINSKQKEAFKVMFDEVDKDKNGSVTLEELKLKMMPSVSRDDIKHFVQVFDLNKDKTVDSREFTAICSLNDKLSGTRTETADGSIALELEKLAQHIVIFKEMYKTMDEDDDNRLDANEVLVMVSATMETDMGIDLEVARRVLDAARDEFGYIDFVGFMSYIPFFANLLKTIMAKPLSIAEIEKARERVKQKQLTFKIKKSDKKEPKSWEAF